MSFARQVFRRLGGVAIVFACVGATASAGAESNVGPVQAAARSCSEAAIVDVRLPRYERVDELRVVVARSSPETGAARVVVATGEFDRVMYVRGGSHGLSFSTPLTGNRFRVSLDPVLGAPAAACVERIELRSRGRLVAAVNP